MRLPFRYLEPTFFAGLLDDPLLYLRQRPTGRGMLFDCGQLHQVAKRVLRSLEAVFITHAHMDHFMGVDTLVRSIHVAPRSVSLFGPPGIARRLEAKLAGYDWNLCESWWGSLLVHEFDGQRLTRTLFSGPEGYRSRAAGGQDAADGEIFRSRYLRVRAWLADHKIPVLIFRIDEQPGFRLDPQRLRRLGLLPGPWLEELRRRFATGWPAAGVLNVTREDGAAQLVAGEDMEAFYRSLAEARSPASIGYLTDIGPTPANLELVENVLAGVTLLVSECSFLATDRERALRSGHLSSCNLNRLLKRLRPQWVLPMHLSKTYLGRGAQIYDEISLPEGTTLLRLPEHVTPAPLLPRDLPWRSD